MQAATMLILIQDGVEEVGLSDEASPAAVNSSDSKLILGHVRWTVSGTLCAVLACLICRSLLHRSLDRPGTLKVDSRFRRLLPRMFCMVILICLPVADSISNKAFLAVIAFSLQLVSLLEYYMSMERCASLVSDEEDVERHEIP
jgi:hypothetical protein